MGRLGDGLDVMGHRVGWVGDVVGGVGSGGASDGASAIVGGMWSGVMWLFHFVNFI